LLGLEKDHFCWHFYTVGVACWLLDGFGIVGWLPDGFLSLEKDY
jgi:hypothetical protein